MTPESRLRIHGPLQPMEKPRLKWGWVILCALAAWVVAGLIAALLLGGW